jgi:hypothetical protein
MNTIVKVIINKVFWLVCSFCLVSQLACSTTYETVVYEEEKPDASVIDAGVDDAMGFITDQMKSRTGWSGGGPLTINGGPNVQATAQADFPKKEGAMHTVQFQVSPPTPPLVGAKSLDGTYAAYAMIQWSVNGVQINRVISVVNGMSISGVGESVKIFVVDATPVSSNQTPGLIYTVDITIAVGSRPSNTNPPYWAPVPYFALFIATAGPVITIPIPQNIGANSLFIQMVYLSGAGIPEPSQAVVVIQNQAGVNLATYNPSDYTDFVPLPPQAALIVFSNPGTGDASFNYMLGIDG